MEWGQELRGRVLRPLLDALSRLGMRANHVTLAGLIIGLAFCPVFLWGSKALAFGLLALHVLALKTLTGFLTKRRRI